MFVHGWCRSPFLPLCFVCLAKKKIRIILLLHIVNFVCTTVKTQFNNTQKACKRLFVGVQRAMVPLRGRRTHEILEVCETDPNFRWLSLLKSTNASSLSLSALPFFLTPYFFLLHIASHQIGECIITLVEDYHTTWSIHTCIYITH